jgi:hypothetical protein
MKMPSARHFYLARQVVISLFAIIPLTGLSACAGHSARHVAPPPVAASPDSSADPATPLTADQTAPPIPHIAVSESEVILVYLYQLTVPWGTFIHNDKFWKLIDEDSVDVGTYDLLYKNGLRVGHGRLGNFPAYAALIDKEAFGVRTTQFFNVAGGGTNILNVNPEDPTQEITEETLFVFDRNGLNGRSYAHCQNRLLFSFIWEPHQNDTVRIDLCPTVEVVRTRMDWWLQDNPKGNPALNSEHLYELGLRLDLGPDDFLVIGASPAASEAHRVGNLFLTHDLPTQRVEQLLLLSRKPLTLKHARPVGATATTRKIEIVPPIKK